MIDLVESLYAQCISPINYVPSEHFLCLVFCYLGPALNISVYMTVVSFGTMKEIDMVRFSEAYLGNDVVNYNHEPVTGRGQRSVIIVISHKELQPLATGSFNRTYKMGDSKQVLLTSRVKLRLGECVGGCIQRIIIGQL